MSRSNARISAIPLIFNIRAVISKGWDSDMVVWGMMRAAHMLTNLLGRDVCAHLRPFDTPKAGPF